MAEKTKIATETDMQRWEAQKKVIEFKAMGMSPADIAIKLGLHEHTVRGYLKDGYAKVTDILLLEGGALGEIINQIDYVFSLALGAFARARRVVSVEIVQKAEGAPAERMPIEADDFYAKSQLVGKMTDLLRLKATVLGFTRADVNVLAQFNMATGIGGQPAGLEGIPQADIPRVRSYLREIKALVANGATRTDDQIQRAHAAAHVKDPPAVDTLPGVILDNGVGE